MIIIMIIITSIIIIIIINILSVADNFPGPNPGHGLRPCPNIFCPAVFIEPRCRKEVIIYNNGVRCLGCPQNICNNNNGYPRPGQGGYEG